MDAKGEFIADISASRESIQLKHLSKDSKVVLSVPFACPTRLDSLDVRISLDYETSERRELRRAFREQHVLDLALPVAVNVQDFFRPDW